MRLESKTLTIQNTIPSLNFKEAETAKKVEEFFKATIESYKISSDWQQV